MYCKFTSGHLFSKSSIVFNRNILYCKFIPSPPCYFPYRHLIGTFCIVNHNIEKRFVISKIDLIGTFCIVNVYLSYHYIFLIFTFNRNILYCKYCVFWKYFFKFFYLIGTFCIVNIFQYFLKTIFFIFNRNILYCKLFVICI